MKKNIILSIIILVVVIISGIFISYKIYDSKINLTAEEQYNKKINEGYEEMIFPEKLSTLYEDVTDEVSNKEIYISAGDDEFTSVTYILKIDKETKKLYYELDDTISLVNVPEKIETEITNVKRVMYQGVGTAVGSEQLFILTEEGDIYYKYNWGLFDNVDEVPTSLNDFQKLNQKYQYDELRMYYYDLWNPTSPVYELIGVVNNNFISVHYGHGEDTYSLSINEQKYVNNRFENIYENDYISINLNGVLKNFCTKAGCIEKEMGVVVSNIIFRSYVYNNEKNYYEQLVLIIDNNDYLLMISNNEYEKISNQKVEYILQKELSDNKISIIIIFEDGSIKTYEVEKENIARY